MPDRAPILPPLRRTAADAEAFARVVHAGQVDKAGRPYVEHLERVANRAANLVSHHPELGVRGSEDVLQIAWLHDVIEDTEYAYGDLLREGFSQHVSLSVEWLTKEQGQPYLDWVKSICRDRTPLAVRIVKLADMEDNADPERLALLPDDVRARLERKYGPALEMLRAAVERGTGRDG